MVLLSLFSRRRLAVATAGLSLATFVGVAYATVFPYTIYSTDETGQGWDSNSVTSCDEAESEGVSYVDGQIDAQEFGCQANGGHFAGPRSYEFAHPTQYNNYNGNWVDLYANGKVYSEFDVTDPNGRAAGNQNCACVWSNEEQAYHCTTMVRGQVQCVSN